MKIVVTGGCGFIGSHLCELLLSHFHTNDLQLEIIDNLVGGREKNIDALLMHKGVTLHKKDIRDFDAIAPIFKEADWVFHLAALADIVPSIENPKDYFETNVDGTFNVLQASKGVKRFIYAASSSCYGLAETFPTPETAPSKPEYPYALTKYLGEQLVMHWEKVYDIPAISLRLFNVYGPRARTSGTYGAVFGVFLAQKYHKKPFTIVGDGNQTRDFTYVTDVARAFLTAALSNETGKIYNVGSGGHYSVNRIVSLLQGLAVHIPERPGEPHCTFADIQKIQNELGWSADVSLEEGISHLLQNIEDFKEAPLWEPSSIKEATKSWFKYVKSHVTT
jgi:UDP-glucose 4-epimerase